MTREKLYPIIFCLCLLFVQSKTNAQLPTHVEITQTGSSFMYTLVNNEPKDSEHSLDTFHLTLNAPITVTNSPSGWDFITDNNTYVDWFNTDSEPPYSHDVAPGSSLSGFTIESTVETTNTLSYGLTFWDHSSDIPNIGIQDVVTVPFTDTESMADTEIITDSESTQGVFLPLINR